VRGPGRRWPRWRGWNGPESQPQPTRCPSTTTKDTVTETIWLDPATYLPVRMARTSSVFVGAAYNIRWLPPTRTNLPC